MIQSVIKLFKSAGRASRAEFSVIFFAGYLAIFIKGKVMADAGLHELFVIAALVVSWPVYCAKIRRMHDMDISAWWAVIFAPLTYAFVQFAKDATTTTHPLMLAVVGMGLVAILLLLLYPGTKGKNQFGPPTKPQ